MDQNNDVNKKNYKAEYLKCLYKNRFQVNLQSRKKIWAILCKYYFQQFINKNSTVIDIAAGYCDFINNIRAKKKYAYDLNSDVKKYANKDVTIIQADIKDIGMHFIKSSCDVVFLSNFLEHVPKKSIKDLFTNIYGILKGGGIIIILTPNIKYVGNKYWDFFEHITPITENSLIEVLELCNYKIDTCIKKFIPYSTKSKLPQSSWIVYLYLKLMPLSGFCFGEQSLIIAKKSKQRNNKYSK